VDSGVTIRLIVVDSGVTGVNDALDSSNLDDGLELRFLLDVFDCINCLLQLFF